MAIQFDVPPGSILLCDYSTGFRTPEMVKTRPVLVVSPRLRHRSRLCTVVPLSTTAPGRPQAYHHQVELLIAPPSPWSQVRVWAKADMLATVAFERLNQFRTARSPGGKRTYVKSSVSAEDLEAVRRCIAHALGLS